VLSGNKHQTPHTVTCKICLIEFKNKIVYTNVNKSVNYIISSNTAQMFQCIAHGHPLYLYIHITVHRSRFLFK